MNKLTKLMLASAVLATSGFATGGAATSILNGTEVVSEGGVFEIENADYVVSTTGSFELVRGTSGDGGILKIGKGSTLKVNGGSLKSTGEGTKAPKIELNGTLEIAESGGAMPTVNLTGVAIVGGAVTDSYVEDDNNKYDLPSKYVMVGNVVVSGNTCCYGKYNMSPDYPAMFSDGTDYWVLYESKDKVDDLSSFNSTTWTGMYGWEMSDDGKWISSAEQIGSLSDGMDSILMGMSLNGKYVAFKKLTKIEGGESTIDLSGLRSGNGYKNTIDAKSAVVGLVPDEKCEVILPVNCMFNALNLSAANKVSYTKYVVAGSTGPGIDGSMIKKITTSGTTYGDYSIDSGLDVTLPAATKLDVTPVNIPGTTVEMNLADIVEDTDYNVNTLKLYTNDLDSAEHAITENTTYNFKFDGSKAVTISGTGVATFAGDNSTYAPTGDVTLPDNVAFAASNSLFKFDVNVKSLEFKGGESAIENTVESGKTVETNVLNVGAKHKVIVNGYMKLVGAQAE